MVNQTISNIGQALLDKINKLGGQIVDLESLYANLSMHILSICIISRLSIFVTTRGSSKDIFLILDLLVKVIDIKDFVISKLVNTLAFEGLRRIVLAMTLFSSITSLTIIFNVCVPKKIPIGVVGQ